MQISCGQRNIADFIIHVLVLISSILLLIIETCSHERSVIIYIATKYQPDKFEAVKYPCYLRFDLKLCMNNARTNVGYGASNV